MITQLTPDGYKKLQDELVRLETVEEPAAVARLTQARSMGDLRENSEYHAAKEDRSVVHGRIQEIRVVLKNAQIVEPPKTDGVGLGSKLKVKVNDEEKMISIVGEFEADPMNGMLSVTSPIGRALMGHKAGDSVDIKIPAGTINYHIISIS